MRVLHESARDGVARRCGRPAAALLVASAIACSGSGLDAGAAVRDSAGIEIVENRAVGAWGAAAAWTIGDTPSVTIGGDESDSTTMFSNVQNAVRLADGRIVVSDYGVSQLRFFDATGRFIKAVGRPGQGPGEFDFLGRILRVEGDSLILWDPNNARLTVFDSGGRVARMVPLRDAQGSSFPDPFGRTADGDLVGTVGSRNAAVGAHRNQVYFVRYGPDLAPVDTIAEHVGSERFSEQCGGGMCGYATPFGRTTSAAFRDDRLYVGDGDRFEVTVIGADGRRIRSVRLGVPNREVTAADVARQRGAFIARARTPQRRADFERVWAAMPVPRTMPAFRDIRVDRAGNLWVENYRATEDEAPRWAVFDSAGRLLGTLATPRSLSIDEIGGDHLIGVYRDSLDVEQVRVYPIVKPRAR